MPILLSALLNQIDNKQDSEQLTFAQATELLRQLVLQQVKTGQRFVLKPVKFDSITLSSDDAKEIKLAVNAPITNQEIAISDNQNEAQETSVSIKVEQMSASPTITFQVAGHNKIKVDLTAQPPISVKLPINGKEETFHIALTQSPNPQVSIPINGEEKKIELDVNAVIRSRHVFAQTDLATLDESELLSAIAINTFADDAFANGAMSLLHRSTRQYHFDTAINQFNSKEKNKKVLRYGIAEDDYFAHLSDVIKNIIAELIGKNHTLRGLHWLNNGEKSIAILPYIDGYTLEDFIGSDQHLELLAKNPDEIKRWILALFYKLAWLHGEGKHVHRDIKPSNIMLKRNDIEGTEIVILDYDFLIHRDEITTSLAGTPEYLPPSTWLDFDKSGSCPDPYQDIYGALIIALLLLKPTTLHKFNRKAEALQKCLFEGKSIDSALINLQLLCREQATDLNIPLLKQVIAPTFTNPEISAQEVVTQLLAYDQELMNMVAWNVVQNNQAEFDAINEHILLAYKKHPSAFAAHRQQLADYFTQCMLKKITYSYAEFIQQFDIASSLESAYISEIDTLLMSADQEEAKQGLQHAIKILGKYLPQSEAENKLSENTVNKLVAELQKDDVSDFIVGCAVYFLTAGNQAQAKEALGLYSKWSPLQGYEERPEFKTACKIITTCLLDGLVNGSKPYNHDMMIKESKGIIDSAKNNKSTLIVDLKKDKVSDNAVKQAVYFLTAGNEAQAQAAFDLYSKWNPLQNNESRPEFKNACQKMITCLLEGLLDESKPYDHDTMIKACTEIIEGTKLNTSMKAFRERLLASRKNSQKSGLSIPVTRTPTPSAPPFNPLGSGTFFAMGPATPAEQLPPAKPVSEILDQPNTKQVCQ